MEPERKIWVKWLTLTSSLISLSLFLTRTHITGCKVFYFTLTLKTLMWWLPPGTLRECANSQLTKPHFKCMNSSGSGVKSPPLAFNSSVMKKFTAGNWGFMYEGDRWSGEHRDHLSPFSISSFEHPRCEKIRLKVSVREMGSVVKTDSVGLFIYDVRKLIEFIRWHHLLNDWKPLHTL